MLLLLVSEFLCSYPFQKILNAQVPATKKPASRESDCLDVLERSSKNLSSSSCLVLEDAGPNRRDGKGQSIPV